MKAAKTLLIGSSLSISEIVERVGYSSIHQFSNAFKLHEDISPSEYRSASKF